MIYFRINYDREYDDPENYPIIEVIKGEMRSKDYDNIHSELSKILLPEFLEKAKVKILRK
jgi:hypothetical protein